MKRFLQILSAIALSYGIVLAQGEDGSLKKTSNPAPKSIENQTKKPKSNPPSKTPNIKKPTIKKPVAKKPNAPKVLYASLSITVSQPESEIFLADDKGNIFENAESAFTGEDGSPLVIDDVSIGTYTLTVRKDGFYEETRKITVTGDRMNKVPITLRPSMAFLSVSTNVDGASIEIEGIGEIENQINNYPLEPGTYRLRVYKNGYEPETREVSLNAVGARQNLSFVLQPFSAEKLLSEAQADFGAQNYEKSAAIARKILAAEPDNAKANLMLGNSLFNLPDPADAHIYLARAIEGGEAVSIPLRIYNKEKGNLQLLPGNLIVTKNAVEFQATNQAFSFQATRGNITELYEKIDEFRVPYIGMKVAGIFNRKRGERTVKLYSEDAVVHGATKKLICPSCAGDSCFCQSKNTVAFQLLEKWRSGDFSFSR